MSQKCDNSHDQTLVLHFGEKEVEVQFQKPRLKFEIMGSIGGSGDVSASIDTGELIESFNNELI